MDPVALLDRLRTGYDDVVDALSGITDEGLDRTPSRADEIRTARAGAS